MTTEDLSGTTWLGPRGGTRKVISRDDAYLGNVWMVRIEGYSVLVPYRAEDIRSWTRVDEKAEPTEDEDKSYPVGAVRHVEHPSETVVAAKARAKEAVDAAKNARTPALSAPILPSDVHDGDLLTGALYGNPFTDWPVSRIGEGLRWTKGLQYLTNEADAAVTIWRKEVTVTARRPAPSPPLPWEEPDAAPYWRHARSGGVSRHGTMQGSDGCDPDEWQGGYFIPADLIERLRTESPLAVLGAILDAAGES